MWCLQFRRDVGIGADATHTVEFREASISPQGDEAVINGAKVMALTAIDILRNRKFSIRYRRVLNASLG